MTPLHHQTIQSQSSFRSYPRPSRARWILLGSGSVLAHLLLIYSIGGVRTLGQLSSQPETAVTPVDWVELPNSNAEPVASPQSSPPPAAVESIKSAATGPVSAEPQLADASMLADASTQSNPSGAIGIVNATPKAAPAKSSAASKPSHTASRPATAASPTAPQPRSEPVPQPAPVQPNPSVPVSTPSPAPPSPRLAMATRRPEQSVVPSPLPSPLITTERIEVPIPDVSQTWTAPEASPSPVITQAIAIPNYLTASVTTDPLPPPDSAEPEPVDEAVQPTTRSRIFSSNPSLSPCPVPQEAIAFLGQTVVLQVQADETGQVVETITQTSSQNAAYDELATCLVKTWKFRPAVTQGQAVANGLLVHITIDRS